MHNGVHGACNGMCEFGPFVMVGNVANAGGDHLVACSVRRVLAPECNSCTQQRHCGGVMHVVTCLMKRCMVCKQLKHGAGMCGVSDGGKRAMGVLLQKRSHSATFALQKQ